MASKLVWSGLAAAILAATSLAAQAADLPARGPVYTKAPPLVAFYNWTGGYAGLNVGYGFATATEDVTGPLGGTLSTSSKPRGIIGGGQLGYNMQSGNIVYGLEADIQYSGQKADSTAACSATTCGAGLTFSETDKILWFGTLRGRLGFAMDRTLIYATGGGAYTGFKSDVCLTGLGCASSTKNKFGWTLGGGVEMALMDRWTAKLEYLYIDTRFSSTDAPFGTTVSTSVRVRDNIVRVGANYHF